MSKPDTHSTILTEFDRVGSPSNKKALITERKHGFEYSFLRHYFQRFVAVIRLAKPHYLLVCLSSSEVSLWGACPACGALLPGRQVGLSAYVLGVFPLFP